ncbi:precorrin-3B synthase [Rhodococcus sp. CH91]|uniref:precorrin-3B synthase n=1 Tax=Rhodococcus sp. CH91 TaxID=2910256 RepID=UPI001F4B2A39|nr:precorrin-3B synthase [Rhodococcus sp. CH91]
MADSVVDVHLPAGQLTSAQLRQLAELAHTLADGALHLTDHAQLQVHGDARAIEAALAAAGLRADSPTRARVLASPLTGRIGGHRDLRELTRTVIEQLADRPVAAGTVVGVDDGRGDIVALAPTVALLARPDGRLAVIREGTDSGVRVDLAAAVDAVLTPPAGPAGTAEPLPPRPRPPVGWLDQPDGGVTLAGAVPGGRLPARLAEFLAAVERPLIVTPWRSVLLCDLDEWTAEQVVRVLAPMGLVFDADSPHLH